MNDLIQQAKTDPKRNASTAEQDQRLEIYARALAFYQQKLDQGCGGNLASGSLPHSKAPRGEA